MYVCTKALEPSYFATSPILPWPNYNSFVLQIKGRSGRVGSGRINDVNFAKFGGRVGSLNLLNFKLDFATGIVGDLPSCAKTNLFQVCFLEIPFPKPRRASPGAQPRTASSCDALPPAVL